MIGNLFRTTIRAIRNWLANSESCIVSRCLEWAKTTDNVHAMFLLGSGTKDLRLVVVMKGNHFDEALEDSLTELDLEIAQDGQYDDVQFNVLACPFDASDLMTACAKQIA